MCEGGACMCEGGACTCGGCSVAGLWGAGLSG